MDPEMMMALQGLTMPVWHESEPSAARAFGIKSRSAAYKATEAGDIPMVSVGRLKRALCAPIRRKLGLPDQPSMPQQAA